MGRDHIYYSIWTAGLLFVGLCGLFDGIRSRLWWVYEPRCHHFKYRQRTPSPPQRGAGGWLRSVALHWRDEDILVYCGLDALCMCLFLRYAMGQCLFASLVGLVALVPAYHTGRGLYSSEAVDDDPPSTFSFSMTTVQNIRCRFDAGLAGEDLPLFPRCENGHSGWRFALVVLCAWIFTATKAGVPRPAPRRRRRPSVAGPRARGARRLRAALRGASALQRHFNVKNSSLETPPGRPPPRDTASAPPRSFARRSSPGPPPPLALHAGLRGRKGPGGGRRAARPDGLGRERAPAVAVERRAREALRGPLGRGDGP